MSQYTCKRCGHRWHGRLKPLGLGRYGSVKYVEAEPVRCAKCRSNFWNKDYVRKISQDRMNAGSYAFTPPLPFNSHDAGVVSRKKISRPVTLRAGRRAKVGNQSKRISKSPNTKQKC
jgi:hypothetical protein